MGHIIDARLRGREFKYRIFSTIVDKYITPELTEAEVRVEAGRDYTEREHRYGVTKTDLDQRLSRAREKGSSSHVDFPVKVESPWRTERCDRCGNFHHTRTPRPNGTCSECGESGEGLRAHLTQEECLSRG